MSLNGVMFPSLGKLEGDSSELVVLRLCSFDDTYGGELGSPKDNDESDDSAGLEFLFEF